MAAPMKAVLGNGILSNNFRQLTQSWVRRQSSWSSLFKGQKEELEEKDFDIPVRKPKSDDGPSTYSRLTSLKKKTSLITVRGYTPPPDVEGKVSAIAESVIGESVELDFVLSDRQHKFEILTRLINEFDHQVPNTELTSMNTLRDAAQFFSIPVRDQTSYEDLAKLDLPPNLHIQMEPIRFSAETDTFFDGQTAFPGQPTVVSSLKYSRKFKGNQGESRNERSITEYERNNR